MKESWGDREEGMNLGAVGRGMEDDYDQNKMYGVLHIFLTQDVVLHAFTLTQEQSWGCTRQISGTEWPSSLDNQYWAQ